MLRVVEQIVERGIQLVTAFPASHQILADLGDHIEQMLVFIVDALNADVVFFAPLEHGRCAPRMWMGGLTQRGGYIKHRDLAEPGRASAQAQSQLVRHRYWPNHQGWLHAPTTPATMHVATHDRCASTSPGGGFRPSPAPP